MSDLLRPGKRRPVAVGLLGGDLRAGMAANLDNLVGVVFLGRHRQGRMIEASGGDHDARDQVGHLVGKGVVDCGGLGRLRFIRLDGKSAHKHLLLAVASRCCSALTDDAH